MIVKVFDISSKVKANVINDKQEKNILKIFDELIKETHLVTNCYLDTDSENHEESPIHYFYKDEDKDNFNYRKIADDLLIAERNVDGSRNNTIREGLLFIKAEDENITIMKLEKLAVIDKATYEFKSELGREKDYFKVCTFSGNYEDIKIIDKNKTAAKYWYQKFLCLNRVRTSIDNTDDIIKLINDKNLYKKKIVDEDNYDEIERFTECYLFDNKIFDKSDLFDELNSSGLIKLEREDELFSMSSMNIDADFKISEKSINKEYSRKLKASDEVTIITKNYITSAINSQLIFEESNKQIIIPISDSYLDDIKRELEKEKTEK